jgi:hypothetical protein
LTNWSRTILLVVGIERGHDHVAVYWDVAVKITNEPGGITRLTGAVSDQAVLHGLLTRIRDLNLRLISVGRLEPN